MIGGAMPLHFKVDDVLTETERAELVVFVLRRSTTVDQAWAWLRTRGKKVSRGAVHNWIVNVKATEGAPDAQLRAALLDVVRRMTPEEVRRWTEEIARNARAARDAHGGDGSHANPESTQV
jgi:hypothetical protein